MLMYILYRTCTCSKAHVRAVRVRTAHVSAVHVHAVTVHLDLMTNFLFLATESSEPEKAAV